MPFWRFTALSWGDEDSKDTDGKTAAQKLRDEKLLELPASDAKAEYITRTFDESGVEILKKAIEQDIHKFSHIPCMTDESFGGNVSGVAMEFKLLGMENITKIKTRYYKKGLRKRLRIFANYLAMKGIQVDVAGITPYIYSGAAEKPVRNQPDNSQPLGKSKSKDFTVPGSLRGGSSRGTEGCRKGRGGRF